MIDPCDCVANIDFNNDDHLNAILQRDKHTRVEGLFTEEFFYQEILREHFTSSSSGWWFTSRDNRYYISKLVLSVSELNGLDFELLEQFTRHGAKTFIIEHDDGEKNFYYGAYVQGLRDRIIDFWSTTRKPYPRNKDKAPIPASQNRNAARTSQAIEYLRFTGQLKRCAIHRVFANCWLGGAYFWDIDYFVRHEDRFLAFEVKQKFPTAKGTWGLNSGLVKLFTYLQSAGIPVVHVILQKPVHDVSIPAIDMYMSHEYKNRAKWIAAPFHQLTLTRAMAKAPSHTSIHNNSELSYFHLPQSDFTFIKNVGSGVSELNNFLIRNFSRQ